jgi:hypothetical protein
MSTEAIQMTSWLVGIAGSVTAVVIARPDFAAALTLNEQRVVFGLLLGTIVCSVLHRVLSIFYRSLATVEARWLYGLAVGYLGGSGLERPAPLQVTWSREEIVKRLDSEFGLDYQFLTELNSPIELCRDAYQAQVDVDKTSSEEMFEKFSDSVSAFRGLTVAAGRAELTGVTDEQREQRRIAAVRVKRIAVAAWACFVLACVMFTVAVATGIYAVAWR